MNRLLICALPLLAAPFAQSAFGATEATVLFAQPGTQIVNTAGVARPVKKGDSVQSGERVITPAGSILQLKLADGSLVGMRPDSQLKIDTPRATDGKGVQVVSLTQGAGRFIGAELMDAKKSSNFTLQSATATLQLKGADLQSAIVPTPTGNRPAGAGAGAGSYNRMLTGAGTIGNGKVVEALAPRRVSFVGMVGGESVLRTGVSFSPFPTGTGPNSSELDTGDKTRSANVNGTKTFDPNWVLQGLTNATLIQPVNLPSLPSNTTPNCNVNRVSAC